MPIRFTTVRNEKLQGLQILQFLSLLYKVAFQVSASCSRKKRAVANATPWMTGIRSVLVISHRGLSPVSIAIVTIGSGQTTAFGEVVVDAKWLEVMKPPLRSVFSQRCPRMSQRPPGVTALLTEKMTEKTGKHNFQTWNEGLTHRSHLSNLSNEKELPFSPFKRNEFRWDSHSM